MDLKQVDLTVDMIFSKGFPKVEKSPWEMLYPKNEFGIKGNEHLFGIHESKMIWLDLKPMIFSGNKFDIREKEKIANMVSGDYCDCCGAKINRHPWTPSGCLCEACESHMQEYMNKKGLWF